MRHGLHPWLFKLVIIIVITYGVQTEYKQRCQYAKSPFDTTEYEARISLLGSVHTADGSTDRCSTRVAATRDESDRYTTFSYLEYGVVVRVKFPVSFLLIRLRRRDPFWGRSVVALTFAAMVFLGGLHLFYDQAREYRVRSRP